MKGKSSKPKGKSDNKEEEKKDDKLKTCNHVKARHILCEKLGKIQTAYDSLTEQHGNKPPATDFAKWAQDISECPSGKKGGDLGWFPRGKMVGDFQNVAFSTPVGQMSNIFKSTHGYHIILVEDYGYNQLSSLASPQNSITSRPSKRPQIHFRESLVIKSKGRVTNKSITNAPVGATSERAHLDDSMTQITPNRNETMRIFQNKFEKAKFTEQGSSIKKRALEGRIKYHDTVKTIEAMVKEAQKEFLTKKKKTNKGTMFVNDLWAQVYQKEVVKQSGMEQTPKRKHKTEISQNFQQLTMTDQSVEETPKTPKTHLVPILTQMAFVNESASKINADTSYLQSSARSFRAPDTPKKIFSDPNPQKARKNHLNKNVWNPARQNCSSVLRGSTHIINQSLASRFNHHHHSSSKNETSIEAERSALTMRDKSREDSLDTYRNAFQRLVDSKSTDYSFTSRLPPKEAIVSTLRHRRARKEQNNYLSSSQNEKKSPRNLSENSTQEIEAAKTRIYLAGKNARLREILGDCEFELQEKGEVNGMIQDLQELFANRKYNREKQLELEQQGKLLDECKFLFKDKLTRTRKY